MTLLEELRRTSEGDLREIAEALAPYTYARLKAKIQGDTRDDRKIRVTAAGSDVKNTAAGVAVKYPGESYFDGLEFPAVTVKSGLNGRIAVITSSGGDLCYDIFLDPDGSAVYPVVSGDPNVFSNHQAAVDYAASLEAGGQQNIRFWCCPGSYGDAQTTNGAHYFFYDAATHGVRAGSVLSNLDVALGYLWFGTTDSQTNGGSLALRNVSMDAVYVQTGAAYVASTPNQLQLSLEHAVLLAISKQGSVGLNHLLVYGGLWESSHVTGVEVDSLFSTDAINTYMTGFVIGNLVELRSTAGYYYGNAISVTNSFQNVYLHGKSFGFSPAYTVIQFNLANVAESIFRGLNKGFSMIVEDMTADTVLSYGAVNNGTISIDEASIIGCRGTTSSIFAKGKFKNSTMGPCAPDNADWSQVVVDSNVIFYTSGLTPAGGVGFALNTDAFVTIGHPADLTGERALTAGSGVGVTDGGANGAATLALANLLADWTQAGLFDISHAGNLIVLKHASIGSGAAVDANNVLSFVETVADPASIRSAISGSLAMTLGANNANDLNGANIPLIISGNAAGAWTHSGIAYGIRSKLTTIKASATTLVIADFRNFFAELALGASTTLTDRYGYRFKEATGAGTLVNQYAIYIEALVKGSTLNYGIFNLAPFRQGHRMELDGIATPSTPASDDIVIWNATGTDFLKSIDDNGFVYNLHHQHVIARSVDGSVTTQKSGVRMAHAGVIVNVTCKTDDGVTIGATAWVGDITLVPVANINTDGGTTSIFTTKPTITNGNMAQNYGAPDLTTAFAAGDWLYFGTTQAGTNATMIEMDVTVRYT